MRNFVQYTPTEVVFGRNTIEKTGALCAKYGAKKVLVHYGSGSVVRSGVLARVLASLDAAGVAHVELGGVVPNPRLSLVYEGLELAKKENVDMILAVGGGSVIDSSKAIAYGLANEGDVWDLYEHTRAATGCAPVGTVLTIAAAGSEMSNSSVITRESDWKKRGYNSEYCRPKFAVMDPEVTMTLPAYQTASGCADIMMHTMERYLNGGEAMELTDGISEALIKTVMHNAQILVDDPKNYDARAEVMWASSLSHNGLTGCGTDGGDWNSHKLEHELGGKFDCAHGAGLAAIWGSWARYTYLNDLPRFKKFALNVMGVADEGTDAEIVLKGIEAMEDFYRSIHMPTCLSELGVHPTEADIADMAARCEAANGGPSGAAMVLTAPDFVKIYEMANH